MHAGEAMQFLGFAENLLDHGVEWLGAGALRVAGEAAQPLEILRGIPQAVDVVEPQSLQLAVGDQLLDAGMDGVESAGVLDAQAGQRIDVEKAAIIDLARRETEVTELVVLTLEQIVQRLDLCGAPFARLVGIEAIGDYRGRAVDRLQAGLEFRRFLVVGPTRAGVARGEIEDGLAGRLVIGAGFAHEGAQDFAVTLRRDRQPVLVVPGREAAFVFIIAQLDLAAFQRLAVGDTEDRQQHAAAAAIRQHFPIDIERLRVGRGRAPFQHVEPPRIISIVNADMVGHEVEDQADVGLLQRCVEPRKRFFSAEFGIDAGMVDDVVTVARALRAFINGEA